MGEAPLGAADVQVAHRGVHLHGAHAIGGHIGGGLQPQQRLLDAPPFPALGALAFQAGVPQRLRGAAHFRRHERAGRSSITAATRSSSSTTTTTARQRRDLEPEARLQHLARLADAGVVGGEVRRVQHHGQQAQHRQPRVAAAHVWCHAMQPPHDALQPFTRGRVQGQELVHRHRRQALEHDRREVGQRGHRLRVALRREQQVQQERRVPRRQAVAAAAHVDHGLRGVHHLLRVEPGHGRVHRGALRGWRGGGAYLDAQAPRKRPPRVAQRLRADGVQLVEAGAGTVAGARGAGH